MDDPSNCSINWTSTSLVNNAGITNPAAENYYYTSTSYINETDLSQTSQQVSFTSNGAADGNVSLYTIGDAININPYLTATITSNNSSPIPNQTVTLTITGTGPASFSSSSTKTSLTLTTNSSGQVSFQIFNINGTNTLTASSTIAGITESSSTTI